jgi:hypothetical protein
MAPHNVIVLNERHLSRLLYEYVAHYNSLRPHRTLRLDSPDGRESQVRLSQSRPTQGAGRRAERVRMGRMTFCHPTAS